jgi:SAM-dependent methyltransferase
MSSSPGSGHDGPDPARQAPIAAAAPAFRQTYPRSWMRHRRLAGRLRELGAERSRLAGIDLDPGRVETARGRLANADIRVGDAGTLAWPAGCFDIVLQSTVLSSILDQGVRRQVAAEMARVLAPAGVIVWYDFFVNNPSNPNVRGVRAAEIRALFPGFRVALERVTLAPPLARRLAPLTWLLPLFLERLRVLNTHYLAVLRRS